MAKLSTSNVGPHDNIIINGDFDIWQRGISFAAAATSIFTADRFEHKKSSDAVVTLTRDTDVPTQAESDHLSNYSHKLDVTTADATIAAGQFQSMAYQIEGYDFAPLQGKYGTFSFWVKSTKTGIFCLSMWCSGADNSYVAEYTVNASDTWEKKTITVNFNGADTGTWDYTNGRGLEIRWVVACGSTYHGTADTWQASQKLATSNQVNGLDNTANNFSLAQVKLELGTVATPLEPRPFAEELAMCQRYYEKSYDHGKYPGYTDYEGMDYTASNGTAYLHTIPWAVFKRAIPTIVTYSPQGGAAGYAYAFNIAADIAVTSTTPGERSMYVIINSTTDGHKYGVHYTVDAEL